MSKQREIVANKSTFTVFAGPNGSGKATRVEDFSHDPDLGIVANANVIEVEAYRHQLIEQRQFPATDTFMSDQMR